MVSNISQDSLETVCVCWNV